MRELCDAFVNLEDTTVNSAPAVTEKGTACHSLYKEKTWRFTSQGFLCVLVCEEGQEFRFSRVLLYFISRTFFPLSFYLSFPSQYVSSELPHLLCNSHWRQVLLDCLCCPSVSRNSCFHFPAQTDFRSKCFSSCVCSVKHNLRLESNHAHFLFLVTTLTKPTTIHQGQPSIWTFQFCWGFKNNSFLLSVKRVFVVDFGDIPHYKLWRSWWRQFIQPLSFQHQSSCTDGTLWTMMNLTKGSV